MANHPQLLLLEKLYSTLNNDSALNSFVNGRIYSNVPDNPTYPYIVIGDFELNDFGSHTFDGVDGSISFHVYTQSFNKKSNMQITNRLYALLHNTDLGIEGFATINFRANFNSVIREPDNRTHHGIQRYDIILGGD